MQVHEMHSFSLPVSLSLSVSLSVSLSLSLSLSLRLSFSPSTFYYGVLICMLLIGHENEDLLGYDLGGSSSENGGHTVNGHVQQCQIVPPMLNGIICV